MTQLLRFPGAVKRDPAVATWMKAHPGALGALARHWFGVMRKCGGEVRELLHDGHPTACVADAGFADVNVFRAHVNVGFFRGAQIADPRGLLEGTGRFMRHVKLRPDRAIDAAALTQLITAAHADMQARVRAELTGAASDDPPERGKLERILPFREAPDTRGELGGLMNLGPKTTAWLIAAGIDSPDAIRQLGPIEVCRQLRARGHPVSVVMAYALEGALGGCHWQDIPRETKDGLRIEFAKMKKMEA